MSSPRALESVHAMRQRPPCSWPLRRAALGLALLHVVACSVDTPATTPAAPAASPSVASSESAATFTVTVDECLLQMGDVLAIGVIRNIDSASHAYVVRVRFHDQAGVVIGESEQEAPALAPGEAFRYQTPNTSAIGATDARCTVVNVEVLG